MTKAKVTALPKPAPAPKPLTEEEKKMQVARFISQKRESIATGVLFNAVNSGMCDKSPADLAKWTIEVADAMIQELYKIPADDVDRD